MVRLAGNVASNAGVAAGCATVVYFPTSVAATHSTSNCCGTTDTVNASGVWGNTALAADKYDTKVTCGSSLRWFRYADEIQHATFQTGDGCSTGTEGNFYWGVGNDTGMRWSTADSSNHAFVIGIGDTSQQIHITDLGAIATDWGRSAGTHPELAIHSNTTPASDYLAIGNHDGTTATVDVVGGTTLSLDIAGNTELTVTSAGLNVPANSDINFTGTTGTNDIVLTNGLADALSITDGSADVMVFDTSTAGNVITATASLALDGDIDFTGPQEITTTTGDLTLNPAASLNVTLTVDDADAFDLSNDNSTYYLVDTRNTAVGTIAHLIDTEDPTLASAACAVYSILDTAAYTLTYTGCTNVTTQIDNVTLGAVTITAASALTVSEANTLLAVAPTEAGCVTLTAASAMRVINAGGTPTTQYGLFIEDLTVGATSDYGIWLAGADTAAIVVASADPIQLGVAGTATGTMNWQGATSGTVNMTVAAAAGCWTLTLPANNGAACEFLQTDGCGITSWAAPAAGAITALNDATANEMVTVASTTTELDSEASLTFDGTANMIFSRSSGGATNTIQVRNLSTCASSFAVIKASNAATCNAGVDPNFKAEIVGVVNWSVGADNSNSDVFIIGPCNPGGNDALRITVATPPVISFNTTQGCDFDFVCENCGWHSVQKIDICPRCGGNVSWHCDLLPILSRTSVASRQESDKHLAQLGVLTLSMNTDGTPWRGINPAPAIQYAWSMSKQNRVRIDDDYNCLHNRVKKLEALLGHNT